MTSIQFTTLSGRKEVLSESITEFHSQSPDIYPYIHIQGDPVHSGSSANGNICAAAALTEGK